MLPWSPEGQEVDFCFNSNSLISNKNTVWGVFGYQNPFLPCSLLILYAEIIGNYVNSKYTKLLRHRPAQFTKFIIHTFFPLARTRFYEPQQRFLSFIELCDGKPNWCTDTPIHGQFWILSSFSVRTSQFNYLLSMGAI